MKLDEFFFIVFLVLVVRYGIYPYWHSWCLVLAVVIFTTWWAHKNKI